ncbi:electron transport complex subunit RsxG [Magnetospira sp. QH-2]|uniref:electron transport complex subunit RsxG n=1 Tax=Magnetospira sp. (strain QH-2) TaxID=1288970 RepID=UPI0003E81A5D|nr:electron transport complex subunit RsxG [Magnetospira sp. QH-2]CCQ72924.1 Electron transport complex protein rnfG [Magnetospira sp. QH-2]
MSNSGPGTWEKLKGSLPFQGGMLGLFAMGAAALLAGGNLGTREAIALRQAEDLKASLEQVLPPDLHDNDLLASTLTLASDDGVVTVYRGTRNGAVTALAYERSQPGYAGIIHLIMGVDRDGRILGVRVLNHKETPGLGDKIEIAKDSWIRSFNGLTISDPQESDWRVKKDGGRFDQFSGATVTPRAVVAAVRGGLRWFEVHRGALLKEAGS